MAYPKNLLVFLVYKTLINNVQHLIFFVNKFSFINPKRCGKVTNIPKFRNRIRQQNKNNKCFQYENNKDNIWSIVTIKQFWLNRDVVDPRWNHVVILAYSAGRISVIAYRTLLSNDQSSTFRTVLFSVLNTATESSNDWLFFLIYIPSTLFILFLGIAAS